MRKVDSKDEFASSITESFGKLPGGETQTGLQHLDLNGAAKDQLVWLIRLKDEFRI